MDTNEFRDLIIFGEAFLIEEREKKYKHCFDFRGYEKIRKRLREKIRNDSRII